MKVLVISATFPPMRSGGSDYAFRLSQRLAGVGVDVRVITSEIQDVVTDERMRVDPVMRRWSWADMPRLLRIARSYRPDVVNLHFSGTIYHYHPMITLVSTFLKRMLPDLRIVTHIEYPVGLDYGNASFPSRAARKAVAHLGGVGRAGFEYGTILEDSDQVIVLSDTHRDRLSEYSHNVGEKCVLIPPPPIMPMSDNAGGFGRQRGREMLGVLPEQIVVSYFGYVYPRKGVETLLEAFGKVAERRDDARLVIIGGTNDVLLRAENRGNYLQELKDLARLLNISDKVIWTGYYPTESEQASLYLRATDICVLPFDSGVYMNNSSFAAAAAHGLPIVTTRAADSEATFKDRENALLCAPRDAAGLAAAIEELMCDEGLRRRLSAGSAAMAEEWFSWDKAVARTIAAFEGRDGAGASNTSRVG